MREPIDQYIESLETKLAAQDLELAAVREAWTEAKEDAATYLSRALTADRELAALRDALREECRCMHPAPEMMCSPCRALAAFQPEEGET